MEVVRWDLAGILDDRLLERSSEYSINYLKKRQAHTYERSLVIPMDEVLRARPGANETWGVLREK